MRAERLPANFGKPWTVQEDELLRAEWSANPSVKEIAAKHARTNSSVRLRLEKLDLLRPDAASEVLISREGQ